MGAAYSAGRSASMNSRWGSCTTTLFRPQLASMLGRLGISVGILLIAAVGGRLVPSLTRNALAGRGGACVRNRYGSTHSRSS